MSLTFYKPTPKEESINGLREEKTFLQTSIVDHPIWKDPEFWESAILNSINEETALQKGYKLEEGESNADTSLRQRNLVFGQLANYSHNMVLFKMEKSEVRNIMTKFCKLFSLSDFQSKEILVIMTSCLCRQIIMLFSSG